MWEHSRRSATLARDTEDVTLETLLEDTGLYAHKRWLKKEKAQLALTLAYSLLQLHGSAWQRRYWSLQRILFLRNRGTTPEPSCLEQPYVSTELLPPGLRRASVSPCADAATAAGGINAHDHPVPGLLALGVVLLELHLNRPVTDHGTAASPNMRLTVLKELDKSDDMGMNYHNAIAACLVPCMVSCYTKHRDFGDSGFRQWYYQHVVSRLKDHLSENFDTF